MREAPRWAAVGLLLFLWGPHLAPVAAQERAPADAPGAEQSRDLVRETLAADIQTADYYELVAWCRSLGLEDTGSRSQLQARLYVHYGLAAPAEAQAPRRVIVVQSARATDYFSVEGTGEDYLILQGDVDVEFRDLASGVTHRVTAEALVVNQTRKTLSASGGVSYELRRRSGAPEVFRGESFTFDLEGWGGLIVDGRGRAERTLEEGKPPVTFYYRGEEIERRANETVILREGSVTSSVAEDPYWQIAASRIWVLGPNEWAIRNAVLKVGRVPLFYLPFFYRPGDELVFHPSLGYRNREGSFIQTTTYLIGRAERPPSALSLLQLTGEEEGYDTRLEGIFLHKVKREDGREGGEGSEKDVLKIMVDYYARLGAFAGIFLSLDPVWTLKGGIGFSRNLYETDLGVYSPLPAGSTEVEWNTARFAGVGLPFRYGIDAGLSTGGAWGSLKASLALFSDPYFPTDFYDRAERIDWTGLLAGPGATAAASTAGGLEPEERESLSWTLNGKAKLSPGLPWLATVEVTQLDVGLYWQGRDNAVLQAEDPVRAAVDPARRFFVPTRVVLPDLRAKIGGTFLDTRPSSAGKPAPADGKVAADESGREPRLEDSGEQAPSVGPEQPPQLGEPAPLPDLPGMDLSSEPTRWRLGYTLEPRFFFESQYNQQSWDAPEQIDFEFLYSSLEFSGKQKLESLVQTWDDRLELKAGFNVAGVYRTRFNRAAELSTADWDALRLKDYQATTLNAGPSLEVAVLPLAGQRGFAKSRLSYALVWNAASLDFDRMEDEEPVYRTRTLVWDASTVDTHLLAGRLDHGMGRASQWLEVKADLPPRSGYYRGEADATLGFSHTNVRGGYRQTESGWVYDPLIVTETLDPLDWLQLESRLDVDANESEMESLDTAVRLLKLRSAAGGWLFEQRVVLETRDDPVRAVQSTLSAFGFSARYLAERRLPVAWNGVSGSFEVTGEDARLLPAELSFTYKAQDQPLHLWRNRIRLTPILSSTLLFDLYRFVNSRLEVTAGLSASIYRFVDLSFSVTSYNNKLYRYVQSWAEEVGEMWVNPWEDLLRSYAFGSPEQRRLSAFKVRSISLKATHDLGDWNVAVEYSGVQKLASKEGGGYEYRWTPLLSIVVEWKPIPQLRRQIRQDSGGLTVSGGAS